MPDFIGAKGLDVQTFERHDNTIFAVVPRQQRAERCDDKCARMFLDRRQMIVRSIGDLLLDSADDALFELSRIVTSAHKVIAGACVYAAQCQLARPLNIESINEYLPLPVAR